MRFTIKVEFGWCGFGFEDGLFPHVDLGFLSIAWCRGWLSDHLRENKRALASALIEIKRLREELRSRNDGP